jgi:hypothetical protein
MEQQLSERWSANRNSHRDCYPDCRGVFLVTVMWIDPQCDVNTLKQPTWTIHNKQQSQPTIPRLRLTASRSPTHKSKQRARTQQSAKVWNRFLHGHLACVLFARQAPVIHRPCSSRCDYPPRYHTLLSSLLSHDAAP